MHSMHLQSRHAGWVISHFSFRVTAILNFPYQGVNFCNANLYQITQNKYLWALMKKKFDGIARGWNKHLSASMVIALHMLHFHW